LNLDGLRKVLIISLGIEIYYAMNTTSTELTFHNPYTELNKKV
jgi:hypothetical protein